MGRVVLTVVHSAVIPLPPIADEKERQVEHTYLYLTLRLILWWVALSCVTLGAPLAIQSLPRADSMALDVTHTALKHVAGVTLCASSVMMGRCCARYCDKNASVDAIA
jgi:hypothetical protein